MPVASTSSVVFPWGFFCITLSCFLFPSELWELSCAWGMFWKGGEEDIVGKHQITEFASGLKSKGYNHQKVEENQPTRKQQ